MKIERPNFYGNFDTSLNKQGNLLVFSVFSLLLLFCAPMARAMDASIVIDANTDMVISQENPDRLLHPASMSKLMTLYLTFEALEQGKLTLQRSFPVSAHAESMSPTKLGLSQGESIRVEDAILSLVTLSANDAAVVLAEGLGGSEDRFGQLMTRKAHQLGMVNTNFRNSNGLPDPAQISTARDMAILCRALIRHFPQYYHYFSTREFTYNGIEHANHNHLMSRYEGMDGLKTGLTNASGFNLAASAVRNGRRLIGVVFGGVSAGQRDDYMADLLDEGFQRAGKIAMTTAVPPPIPGHKPSEQGAPAMAGQSVTNPNASNQIAALPPTPMPLLPDPKPVEPNTVIADPLPALSGGNKPAPSTAATLNVGQLAGIAALAAKANGSKGGNGQGDIEGPEDARRVPPSTPAPQRLALATPPRKAGTTAKIAAGKTAAAVSAASWSIQVGAYATRKATEEAIQQAIKRAPSLLKHTTSIITALPQGHGTLYRARLSGLEAGDARKACQLLSHCLTVPPGAS